MNMIYKFLLSLIVIMGNNGLSIQIQKIKTDFVLNKYQLYVYYNNYDIVQPLEPYECIKLINGNHFKYLHDIGDLEGVVKIKNKNDAINFVRLRTSLSTWYLWPDYMLEIMDKTDIDKIQNYGLPKFADSKDSNGYMGLLSNEYMQRLNIRKAYVSTIGNLYIVKRSLLIPRNTGDFSIVDVEERVYSNGRYICKKLNERIAPKSIHWYIFKFE